MNQTDNIPSLPPAVASPDHSFMQCLGNSRSQDLVDEMGRLNLVSAQNSPLLNGNYGDCPEKENWDASIATPQYKSPESPYKNIGRSVQNNSESPSFKQFFQTSRLLNSKSSKQDKNPSPRQEKTDNRAYLKSSPQAASSNARSSKRNSLLLHHINSTPIDESPWFTYKSSIQYSEHEKKLLKSSEIQRISSVCQLFFLDHYFDQLRYLNQRQKRLNKFLKATANESPSVKEQAWTRYCGQERSYLRKRRTRISYKDFQVITQVGQGGFGAVYLARKKDTREVVALKIMSKKVLHKLDEIKHILTERDILTTSNSPWLVRLLYAFQDNVSIYFALEFVPGGDFRTLLSNSGVLRDAHAKFYAAEMFLAVDALHRLGYIHRDLKPENFLIDNVGHMKLTDFGLAAGLINAQKIESMRQKLQEAKEMYVQEKTVRERQEAFRSLRAENPVYAQSLVGSPDYMAPEVLQKEQYDHSVDYWSLGTIIFECLAGFPPFAGACVQETWYNLRNWQKRLQRPVYDDPCDAEFNLLDEAWDFILKCLSTKDKRYKNLSQVKQHPYFKRFDWDNVRTKCTPPFIPELSNEVDAGYFDDFTNEKDMSKYKDIHKRHKALETSAEKLTEPSKPHAFVGFTFRHQAGLKLSNLQLNSGEVKEYGTMF